ncbi:hypothetical protein B296_00047894 [Ensete ventricosum]|uniref:Transposase (putative) gypsy type domain-containing protein n=1 Tax=Ensete ventricosum TaxID=4639 RepID=A0A426X239_ENSVE|nr:hypothetical protein B296_00047894 [Ensete ventricosum]
MCIMVDALEVDLRFPLHPLIEECLRWWRMSLGQVAPNSWRYLVVFLGEHRGAGIIPTRDLFMACFRLCKSRGDYYLTARVDFRVTGVPSNNKDRMDLGDLRRMLKMSSGADEEAQVSTWRGKSRSHSKGKELAAPSEEPFMPVGSDEGDASPVHYRPRSMKDLFKIKVHKGNAGYYTLQMSDLGHQDPDKEMKARWRGLKNSTKVWNDSSVAEEFERGLLHPQLAWELYTLPSEVLLARAAKEMILVSSRPLSRHRKFSFYRVLINCCSVQSQHFQMALFDRVHDASRLITFMDYRISQLQQELDALKSGEGPEAFAKAEERASELEQELEKTKRERDETLQLARAELPKQAVDRYKESAGFKEGLKRMGRVTYEYGYRVALARFHSLHPELEVEEDPFTIHPEDDLVPIERQQTFDHSDPPES